MMYCMDTATIPTSDSPITQNNVIPPVTPVILENSFEREVYRLRQQGLGYQVIAKELKTYPMKVKRVCDKFVTDTAKMLHVNVRPVNQQTVQERLKQLAPECVETVNDLRSDKSADIKLRASQDILNRAGYTPVMKQAVQVHLIDEMNRSEKLDLLRSMMIEQGLINQDIDVTPIDTSTNTNTTT